MDAYYRRVTAQAIPTLRPWSAIPISWQCAYCEETATRFKQVRGILVMYCDNDECDHRASSFLLINLDHAGCSGATMYRQTWGEWIIGLYQVARYARSNRERCIGCGRLRKVAEGGDDWARCYECADKWWRERLPA